MSQPYVDETVRVRAALAVIPADDYGTWVDMAFALKNGLGDAGFEIWDEWSRTAANYNERAARTTWRSAKETGGKTLASLFWLARQHGFDLKRSQYPDQMATALAPRADVLEQRAREEARQRVRQAAVAREAQAIWEWARPVGPEHPYLARKQLDPVPTLRELEAPELHALLGYAPASEGVPLTGRVLVVPFWIGEAISTLELIDENGRKSSLAGGLKRGGYWIAGQAPNDADPVAPIVIGEGMATVLSAHRATGWAALASLSSGTLPQVAGIVRARFPDTELVVLADIGPGEAKAREAAQAARAHLALPVFAQEVRIDDQVPTDFNDMAVLSGFETVGDRLREIVYGHKEPLPPTRAPAADVEAGTVPGEPKEEVMGNVKEKLVNEAQEPSRRRGSRRSEPKPVTPPEASAPAASSVMPELATTTPADDSSAVTSRQFAPTRPPVGEPLFAVADVPHEVRALAEHRFGSPLRMGTPRENGGPYRGEVFNTEHYLIQEVATRSVVFHPKVQMEFVSERLRWMDENARLNGTELQVGYQGARPKVYPWDRARELLERTVGSLKKSARELNFSPNLEVMLDQLQTRSWARVREARAAALEQSKERGPDR
ncbi:PriCT-2 domain-containing protein [Paraburkholderia phenoliruptrix]|uniref:PriCT-2 domain-containing protein n=1 Tax=Paraburkholderia phenoliruptrix TaxID=252970 RepID=UPI001C6E3009|nr:PriCT-2 domain-containing protein [Paraburkholderia phenoliruptrix]MBW9105102.1 PriCT-2 domain-containing protein [Paraburkholderia phenoliruptrix]MBW9129748.1 PriCT-2 domain-containing protein [Paraburkholderia ginsengiterrae]